MNACYPHVARVEVAISDPGDRVRTWLADREAAEKLVRIAPQTTTALHRRHLFTSRVIEHALSLGITQFLELGSGDPHISAAHATVSRAQTHPAPTIVLVDHDPIVYARAWADEQERPEQWRRSTFVEGNVFAIGAMLNSLTAQGLLDPSQRVCVLAVDILHFAEPEIDIRTVPRRLARRLAPGSLFAATHLTAEPLPAPASTTTRTRLRTTTTEWCRAHHRCARPYPRPRSHADFTGLFTGLDLLAPGITTPGHWPAPDNTHRPRAPYTLAAVGRVRTPLSSQTSPDPRRRAHEG